MARSCTATKYNIEGKPYGEWWESPAIPQIFPFHILDIRIVNSLPLRNLIPDMGGLLK